MRRKLGRGPGSDQTGTRQARSEDTQHPRISVGPLSPIPDVHLPTVQCCGQAVRSFAQPKHKANRACVFVHRGNALLCQKINTNSLKNAERAITGSATTYQGQSVQSTFQWEENEKSYTLCVICPGFPLDLTGFFPSKHLIQLLANKMQDFRNFVLHTASKFFR